jgi:hypothetical protein
MTGVVTRAQTLANNLANRLPEGTLPQFNGLPMLLAQPVTGLSFRHSGSYTREVPPMSWVKDR